MAKLRQQESDSFPKEGCTGDKLSHLVFVHVTTNVGTWFSAILTRVPCVGEYIINHTNTFKVVAVYHSLNMEDGRSRCGLHAMIDVELQPDAPTHANAKRAAAKRSAEAPVEFIDRNRRAFVGAISTAVLEMAIITCATLSLRNRHHHRLLDQLHRVRPYDARDGEDLPSLLRRHDPTQDGTLLAVPTLDVPDHPERDDRAPTPFGSLE